MEVCKMKVYQQIASLMQAMNNCEKSGNTTWYGGHENNLYALEKSSLPAGSGFDSGCTINLDKSTPEKIVIECPYHCMNDNGYYDYWVYPAVIITPSLQFSFDLKLNWKGYNGKYKFLLSDYITDTFEYVLNNEFNG
jgi:hypothetical protein